MCRRGRTSCRTARGCEDLVAEAVLWQLSGQRRERREWPFRGRRGNAAWPSLEPDVLRPWGRGVDELTDVTGCEGPGVHTPHASPRKSLEIVAATYKPRLLGHWGTYAGPELRLRPPQPGHQADDLDMIYVAGPGHGGPAVVANVYLGGDVLASAIPTSARTTAGMQAAVQAVQSFPGGDPQPCRPRDARLDPRRGRARLTR